MAYFVLSFPRCTEKDDKRGGEHKQQCHGLQNIIKGNLSGFGEGGESAKRGSANKRQKSSAPRRERAESGRIRTKKPRLGVKYELYSKSVSRGGEIIYKRSAGRASSRTSPQGERRR